MDKSYKLLLAQTIIFVCIIIGMIYIYVEFNRIDKSGAQCINDPFAYGADIMKQQDNNYYAYRSIINDTIVNCECRVSASGTFQNLKW